MPRALVMVPMSEPELKRVYGKKRLDMLFWLAVFFFGVDISGSHFFTRSHKNRIQEFSFKTVAEPYLTSGGRNLPVIQYLLSGRCLHVRIKKVFLFFERCKEPVSYLRFLNLPRMGGVEIPAGFNHQPVENIVEPQRIKLLIF